MIRIFVDANALLRFYDSNRSEYKKLIASLDAFADHFYVTNQVANEVLRNRLNLAVRAARGIEEKLQEVAKISLPEHFEVPAGEGIVTASEWNTELTAFREQHKVLSKNLHAYFSVLLKAVAEGTDNVSKTLDRLFQGAKKPTPAQLSEAVDRKQFGNPPGKKTDPIGDQLSWVLLRDSHTVEDELWLVTHDSDYYEEFAGKTYLNPFLLRELSEKLGKIPSACIFKDLGTAIRELQKRLKKEVIPEETLVKVQEEESLPPTREVFHAQLTQCPKCKSNNCMISSGAHPSQYGGWTYWDICTKCGFRMDSGEFYDD